MVFDTWRDSSGKHYLWDKIMADDLGVRASVAEDVGLRGLKKGCSVHVRPRHTESCAVVTSATGPD